MHHPHHLKEESAVWAHHLRYSTHLRDIIPIHWITYTQQPWRWIESHSMRTQRDEKYDSPLTG